MVHKKKNRKHIKTASIAAQPHSHTGLNNKQKWQNELSQCAHEIDKVANRKMMKIKKNQKLNIGTGAGALM